MRPTSAAPASPSPAAPRAEAPATTPHELGDRAIEAAVTRELALDRAVAATNISVDVVDGVVALIGTTDNLIARERAARIAEAVKGVRSVSNRIDVRPIARTDEEIESDVEARLLLDPAAERHALEVDVTAGVVTLRGTANSWYERRHAVRIAEAVKGVRAVDDEIDIYYEAERSDAEIASEIESRLRWDVLVDDALIDVTVEDGAVTLSGIVGSAAERTRAREDAWVTNVVEVDASGLAVEWWARDTRLREDKYADVSDEAIRDAIRDALAYDPRVSMFDVGVDVAHGVVTLRGEVDRFGAKEAAEQIARNTVGVVGVTSEIELSELRDDDELAAAIEVALALDPITESYEIDVDADAGAVTLAGTVDSFLERAEAESVALRTRGVWTVVNELEVERYLPLVVTSYLGPWLPVVHTWTYVPAQPSHADPDLVERTRAELAWNPFVASDDIVATAANGVVTLSGVVSTPFEKREAAREAFEAGAMSVVNDLEVTGAP